MKHKNKEMRIPVEETCEECKGSGKHSFKDTDEKTQEFVCSACDGEGYQQFYVTLKQLKTMLEGL